MDTAGADAPAPPARSRWWVWSAVLVATLVGATGFAIVDQPPDPGDGPDVAGLLPPDGAAWEVVDERYGGFVVEAGRFSGFEELFDLPDLVSIGIADALDRAGQPVADARFYREIWTPLAAGDPTAESSAVGSSQITATYWLADDGIRLASLSGGASGFVYSPPQLIVPASVVPGSTWSSEGDALPGGLLRYRTTGSAAASEHGCLEITTETTIHDPDADASAVSTALEIAVWCRDTGSVASASRIDGLDSASTTRPIGGGAGALAAAMPRFAPAAVGDWRPRALPIVAIDPVFGETEQFLVTSPTGATTASGVTAVASGRDVVGVVVDGDRAVRRFIVHPGGDVVRVAAVGDLVLVATSDRRLVAYDDRGARRWAADFADIVVADAVGDGSGGVLVVSLVGELRRLDGADGSTTWSRSIGVDVSIAPAVVDGDVVVAGRDGTIIALDRRDGATAWTADAGAPIAMSAVDDLVVVLTGDGTLLGLDAGSGERAWIRTAEGGGSVVPVDEGVVVRTTAGVDVVGVDGALRWRHDSAVDAAVPIGGAIALVTDRQVDLLDGRGAVILAADLPSAFGDSRSTALPHADGLLLVAGTGELLLIGPTR